MKRNSCFCVHSEKKDVVKMISKQKKAIKKSKHRFAITTMIMVIVVVLLATTMSGCIDRDADSDSDSNSGSGSGSNAGINSENPNSLENENMESNDSGGTSTNTGNTPSSSLPDVVKASGSTGGSNSGSTTPWLATVPNPFIGTWISDPDELGATLVYKGYADGTFEYEMRNLPAELESFIPSEGTGAYIVQKDVDGTNVAVSYFDFGMIKSNKFDVQTNDLIKITEFTLSEEEGQKKYGESTYFRREGVAVQSDYVPTRLSDNILITSTEFGWGADFPEPDEDMQEILLETFNRDYYPSVWKFNDDGTTDCTFLDFGLLMGTGTKDLTYPFSYAVYDDDDDEKDRLILYTGSEEGNELFVLGLEFDLDEYFMTSKVFLIEAGFEAPSDEILILWPYPYVNPKVIEKDNNKAGLLFLTMPDSEEWQESIKIANDNGFMWAHESTIAESSSSKQITGKYNQMEPIGLYPSGFSFSISTTAEDADEIRPAIGFCSFFEFTPENLGRSKYDTLVSRLEALPEGWAPAGSVLTELGIHVYTTNLITGNPADEPSDITDDISIGFMFDEYNRDTLLFGYGAVMVDDAKGLQGEYLKVTDEYELVWSDSTADGKITGEWWIGLDKGTGTVYNPYWITTPAELNNVRNDLSGHYVLMNDIDLSGYENWEPIGSFVPLSDAPEDAETPNLEFAFTGTFDGNGYTISDLTVEQEDDAIGLFGCVVDTTTLKGISINGMRCPNCIIHVRTALEELEGVERADVVVGYAVVVLTQEVDDDILMSAVDNAGHYEAQSVTPLETKQITITGMNCPNCIRFVKNALEEIDGVQRADVTIGSATVVLVPGIDAEADAEINNALIYAVDNAHHYKAHAVTSTSYRPSIFDLTVEDVDITGKMLVGGVVGYLVGDLKNVDLVTSDSGNNNIQGTFMIGGIAGGGFGNLVECDAEADILALGGEMEGTVLGGSSAGVLAGGMESGSIYNCTAVGTVTAEGDGGYGLGGLAGCVFDGLSISGSSATVTIEAQGDGTSLIGGLLGFTGTNDVDYPTSILNCKVNADITVADDSSRIGGITGGGFYMDAYAEYFPNPTMFKIKNCSTAGTITGAIESTSVGSIAGHAYHSEVADDCTSTMTWNGDYLSPVGENVDV